MQPLNLWLYAINCHLLLCFIICITIQHPFQSIIIIIIMTMVQLLSLPSFLVDLFLGFLSKKRPLYQIYCKNNHNLVTSMWCTYMFYVHYIVLKYIKVYL
jgi:hypothetical protein